MLKKAIFNIILILFSVVFLADKTKSQSISDEFISDSIISIMHRVNNYQLSRAWRNNDRNWKRATFYTGVMAFYKATGDSNLLNQAIKWSSKHTWRVGAEWIYPANRLTCTQTYLEIYFIKGKKFMIKRTKEYMDSQLSKTEPAYDQGWDYIDALFVGAPAYVMMSKATGEKKYSDYMNRIFWEVADYLFDEDEKLFYRDNKARKERSKNGKKVLWSRGNGWVIASLPCILTYLSREDSNYSKYEDLLKIMAHTLAERQGQDGLWRTNLADADEYPMPESSGTAFFTYAMAWGINNGILDPDKYLSIVKKAWKGLYNIVDEDGKVCWGQQVSRDPGKVDKDDSEEYVAGAFLLAGSEVLKLTRVKTF